jgi:hypothetical protein
MSLVLNYDQRTKEISRLLYIHNNVSEIVHSHGTTMLEVQRDYYKHHKSLKKPFNLLPKDYESMDLQHQLFAYDIARIHQYESVRE